MRVDIIHVRPKGCDCEVEVYLNGELVPPELITGGEYETSQGCVDSCDGLPTRLDG